MNKTIKLGTINTLMIDRIVDYGLYLVSKDNKEVLLPNQYVTDDMKLCDLIDVCL